MKTIISFLLTALSITCLSQTTDFLVTHTGDTVFGKILLKQKTFFITDISGNVKEMNAAPHVVVQKGYINQLRFIMGDCKKISDEEWEMLDYRIYSLKALIKRYNKCK